MAGSAPPGDRVTWASTVPDAIDGLLAAWRASPDLAPPVDVRDGPVITSSTARDAVICGWSGVEGDETAADGQEIPEGLAGNRDREQYAIRCAALSEFTGSSAAASAARVRAYALASACGAAVTADRQLGGLVLRAMIGPFTLRYVPGPSGMLAAVEFSVTIDAFTTRQ